MEKGLDVMGVLLNNNHEKKHKSKPNQFVSVAGGIQKRLENNLRYRKSCRLTEFDIGRDLSNSESPVRASLTEAQLKIEKRRQQLQKWKEEKEKERQKKAMVAQKKKPFVTGIYHAPLNFEPPPPPKVVSGTSARVTRSQSAKLSKQNAKCQTKPISKIIDNKRLSIAPKNAKFHPPQLKNVTLPIFTIQPIKGTKEIPTTTTFEPVVYKTTVLTRSQRAKIAKSDAKDSTVKVNNKKQVEAKVVKPKVVKEKKSTSKKSKITKTSRVSSKFNIDSHYPITINDQVEGEILPSETVPDIHTTPKAAVPKSESSSEEKLRSPKSSFELPMTPEQIVQEAKKISPCVTMSRGKDNARKEMKKKLEEGLLDDDASDVDSVQYFKRQLASEIDRMTEMCVTWDKIYEQNQLPDHVQELVLGAVGQARLLMSQKLQQFARLVQRSAAPELEPGAALVTPADLHGFWDMVFMQIENVDLRFKKLEELQKSNWIEDLPQQPKKIVPKKNVKKPTKPAAAGGASKLKEMIAAARRAQKQQTSEPAVDENKTFDAGFFCVKSPVKTSPFAVMHTPSNKKNLLKSVLSSEAKKASASKCSTSYAMLRASLMSRNVEIEGVAPLEQTPKSLMPINLHATPARSILKSSTKSTVKRSTNKSTNKSIKTVLFDDNSAESEHDSTELNIEDSKAENSVKTPSELNTDSPQSMDYEGNSIKKTGQARLRRQDAVEISPFASRDQRRSDIQNDSEAKSTKRLSNKKPLQLVDVNIIKEDVTTPNKYRKKKSITDLIDFDTVMVTPRRSSRIMAREVGDEDVEAPKSRRSGRVSRGSEVTDCTPKRSSRSRGKKATVET